jgi:hypothetical protein
MSSFKKKNRGHDNGNKNSLEEMKQASESDSEMTNFGTMRQGI